MLSLDPPPGDRMVRVPGAETFVANEGQSMRVLVVEDDEFTRTLLVGAISSLGHEVASAVDGSHGWSHIQTALPDMVISDLRMPGMDGLDLCARVRNLDAIRPVHFVLLVAETDRASALRSLEGGVDDYLLKPVDLDELQGRLVVAARWIELHRDAAADKDDRDVLQMQLQESAERDPLTRVYNALRLDEDVAAISDRATRYGHRYALALIDIDHFTAYNDTYGHVAGDEALVCIADLVSSQRRAGDAVYRYGGQQFLLLLPEQSSDGARVAAERIRTAIARTPVHHRHLDVEGHVTVSVGIAELVEPENGFAGGAEAFEAALQRADAALRTAKRSGRNRIAVSDEAIARPEVDH